MTAQPEVTILLVDDDLTVLSLLQVALARCGYQVIVASDAAEALQRHEAEQGAIDLLITDMKMPKMSGTELAERLRQRYPELPIVFISGDPGAEDQLRDEGFSNSLFVQKPFVATDLIERLPSVLGSTTAF